MSSNKSVLPLLIFIFTLAHITNVQAQADIKVNNIKINHIDKKKRKQGEWIFFDKDGNIRLSCTYNNDSCISPVIFYENTDTAFIKFPIVNSTEPFILYQGDKRFYGSFVYTSDTTSTIVTEPDAALTDEILVAIEKYQQVQIQPLYYFAQKRLIDYISASFSSSRFIFNKPLSILLSINTSGQVTNVEFKKDKVHLTVDEERELYWIYSTMPRWQPYFYRNKVKEIKVLVSNKATITVL